MHIISNPKTFSVLLSCRCHSDDPLISGAIDDNQNEFNPIKTTASPHDHHLIAQQVSPCQITPTYYNPTSSNLSAGEPRKKVPRTRRKGQFKLRFHHQALPQEYLEHYEATQNSQQKRDAEKALHKVNKAVPFVNSEQASRLAVVALPQEISDNSQATNSTATHDSVRNWLQKIYDFQSEPTTSSQHKSNVIVKNEITDSSIPAKSSRVVSYSDLPYMGEMTLDNSKPRRGRKPKKADICHLIYKNYGTILPGTPKELMENHSNRLVVQQDQVITNGPTLVRIDLNGASSELQSRLLESLLDKKCATAKEGTVVPSSSVGSEPCSLVPLVRRLQAEPLNLCVRDGSAQETFTVDSSDDEDATSTSSSPHMTVTPSETDSTLANHLKMSLPNFKTAMLDPAPGSSIETPSTGDSSFGYWPNSPFIHPISMYYQQKMAETAPISHPNLMSPPIPPSTPSTGRSSTPAVSPMPPPSPSSADAKREPVAKILIAKNISKLLKQQEKIPQNRYSSAASEASSCSSIGATTHSSSIPAKRKRSAIFIPPMPVESSTNHATEVSICKFKFTGGAKPSLQEKKMLSVDAGGNFRYYSGTGDKSMRGYEFFPRESLQQSSLMAASSAGAFLNTPGEKMNLDLSPPSLGLSNEVLQIPELPSPTAVSAIIQPHLISSQPAMLNVHLHNAATNSPSSIHTPPSSSPATLDHLDRRKRKSRRSLQRENLEKTFKEKGFLIQTQQHESAEGATYCKFRQLRKFTRYLFRSWKDYLPGEMQNGKNGLIPTNELDASHLLLGSGGEQLDAMDESVAHLKGIMTSNSVLCENPTTTTIRIDTSPMEDDSR